YKRQPQQGPPKKSTTKTLSICHNSSCVENVACAQTCAQKVMLGMMIRGMAFIAIGKLIRPIKLIKAIDETRQRPMLKRRKPLKTPLRKPL
ncbi:hypothetical protein AMR42_18155, partial [Limnothrix sp. PR1529]